MNIPTVEKTKEQRKQELSSLLSNIDKSPVVSGLSDTEKSELEVYDGLEIKLGDVVLGTIDLERAEKKHTKKGLPFISLFDSGMYPDKVARFGNFDLMKRVAINLNPLNRTAKS